MRTIIQLIFSLSFSATAIAQGPVAFYPFNGNAKDESGNNNNGTLVGNPASSNDRFNNSDRAYFFNGSGQYINVSNKTQLGITKTVSLAAWVKRTRFGIDMILEKGGDWTAGSTNYGLGLHQANNNMFYFFFRGGWRGTDGVKDLNWHHYAVVAVNGQANPVLYIDGIQRPVKYSEGSAKISLFRSAANLHIGAQVGSYNYYGANCIDEVRIYNRALSADEIKKLMDMATQPDMVAYYPFNGNAKDESGNNNDGIVVGSLPLVQDNFNHAKGAYAFGPVQYIKVPDKPELRITNTVSITAWVKRTRFGIDMIVEKGGDWTGGTTNYGLSLHSVYNNMFYFFFKGGWRGADGVSDFGWHHYAVVAVNGEINPALYIDGKLRPVKYAEGAASINLFPATSELHIGAQVASSNYHGSNIIDELRIYNRALSEEEIKILATPDLQPGK